MTTLIPKYDQGATSAVNRPINQKLAESVSVKDFGVVGDGDADRQATGRRQFSKQRDDLHVGVGLGVVDEVDERLLGRQPGTAEEEGQCEEGAEHGKRDRRQKTEDWKTGRLEQAGGAGGVSERPCVNTRPDRFD